MKKKVLKMLGAAVFAVALFVNVQSSGKATALQEENMEAIAEATDTSMWHCKYITDLGVCAIYWANFPLCPTGC